MTNDLPDWASVVSSPDTPLSGSPVLYNTGSTSTLFTMPTGVHLLSIILQDYPDVTELTVTGEVTGVVYLDVNPSTSVYQHQYYVLISAAVEVQVNITTVASVAGRMWVTGSSETIAVAALAQGPAPWEAPNMAPMTVHFTNPGSGGSATLIAAPAPGKSIWLHTMSWFWATADVNLIGQFKASGGTVVCDDVAVAAGVSRFVDYKGAKIDTGVGFIYKQNGSTTAGTVTCYGSIAYSVY